jgi:hypothetical protein
VHALDHTHACRIYRKVRVATRHTRAKIRVSACSPDYNPDADWQARVGVYDGSLVWLTEAVIDAGPKPSPQGWHELTTDLGEFAGREVLVILECAAGGPKSHWANENAFIDEFSIK